MSDSIQSFYWYDYETWGLKPALDRPSQFAGIRTDADFNILGEADMFYCRLPDDYLPAPEPALITGITPDIVQQQGLREFEFAKRIHQHFTQPGTCVVGYNTIRFDDEFTRYLFYRNFYDPYEYTWKNGNSRWDIIDLVRACYALRPDGICWPTDDNGDVSFRLEYLTQANQIEHSQAHDAMSDVYATLSVARLIKSCQPRLFEHYLRLRQKQFVNQLIHKQHNKPVVHVSGMFGKARSNVSLVLPLTNHPTNPNAWIAIDLAKDVSPLMELSFQDIQQRLYTRTEDLGDELPIPLKLIHSNKSPFLAPLSVLQPQDIERLQIDIDFCHQQHQRCMNTPDLADKLGAVFQKVEPFAESDDVDSQLYSGFFSNADKNAMSEIHAIPPEQLAHWGIPMQDSRFESLLFRYRARNFPETLSVTEQQTWRQHRQNKLNSQKTDYLNRLQTLLDENATDSNRQKILIAMRSYAETLWRLDESC